MQRAPRPIYTLTLSLWPGAGLKKRASSFIGCQGAVPFAYRAYGIPGRRVIYLKDLTAAVEEMVASPGPFLLDVLVQEGE